VENIKPILKALVQLLAIVGATFTIDWLANGACATDSILGLGVEACQEQAATTDATA